MAKISLRAYNNEISEMVDHGQIDEAIAHCRHILQTYPRHVDTYRLLGKAYLEGQRYGDAADILQRVLSSVPEDFIAHVGMSIIREDEGNMDAAIWHMERAFEGQPSNQAIQDELRRLYGRRDGREPARVRLTRGALARMYAHGNLHDQAVAELQAALTEDPQRPDLSILLAEMYYQTGKKADAADACTKLLAKLPNCLAANRLLTLLLDEKTHAEERTTVRKRWFALDPYAARMTSVEADPASVPDDAITLDNLDYDPTTMGTQTGGSKPGWASSLGVDLGEQEESADWLSAGAAASSGSLFGSATEKEKSDIFGAEDDGSSAWGSFGSDASADDSTPDWMSASAPAGDTGDADSDTPDWLSAAAPTASAQETDDETPDWLQAAPPVAAVDDPADSVPDWLSAASPAGDAEEEKNETPDWLAAAAPTGDAEPATDETPDWLAAGVAASGAAAIGAAAAAADDDGEEMSWLDSLTDEVGADLRAEAAGNAAQKDEDSADWLKDLEGETTEPTADAGDAPDWLSQLADEGSGRADEKPDVELPDFLKKAGWEPGSGAAEEPTSILDEDDNGAELAPADVPDWMQQLQPPTPTAEDDDFAAALSKAAETTGGNLGWDETPGTKSPGENTLASFLQETQPTAANSEDDWLTSLTADEPQGEETMAPTSDDDQDWLKKLAGESSGSDDDDLESMDWLDSLTDEVGADLRAEAAAATPAVDDGPDWLKDLGDAPAAPVAAAPATSDDLESMDWLDSLTDEVGADLRAEAAAAVPAADDGPDWLKDLGDAPAAPVAAAPTANDDLESMDWLDSLTDEVGADLRAEAAAAAPAADDGPDWLRDLGDAPAAPVAAAPAASDDLESMDWLDSLTDEVGADLRAEAAAGGPPMAAPDGTDDALAWMENLAAKQGAAEEELLTQPGNRLEDVPEWVHKAAETPPARPAPHREGAPKSAEPAAEKYVPPTRPETPAPAGPGTDLSEVEGMDDALAWLEGLAANQGAAEDELVTQPERRTGELPRWAVEQATAANEPPTEPLPAPLPVPAPEPEPAGGDMAWLDNLAAETSVRDEEENAADDWLKQLETEKPAEAEAYVPPAAAPPSWLDEITEEPDKGIVDATPSVPEWLQDVADSGQPARAMPAPPAAPPKTPEVKEEARSNEWIPEAAEVQAEPVASKAAPVPAAADAPAARPTPVRASTAKPKLGTAGKTDDIRIAEARKLLADGEIDKAAEQYGKLVGRGRMVEDVIVDLREALRRHPVDVSLWQALGDAYTRQDLLQEAMDAYSKAEGLLRF